MARLSRAAVRDPAEWTRGHVFTVAQEIVELAPRAWYITARDGVPLSVTEHAAGAAADATVTMSPAAFDRLLRGEPALDGDRPLDPRRPQRGRDAQALDGPGRA